MLEQTKSNLFLSYFFIFLDADLFLFWIKVHILYIMPHGKV